jgi:hypothetical protein
MPVAPILGATAALGSLGLGAASTAYGISEQEQAKQRAAENNAINAQNRKEAMAAARISGNILSQDYIDKTLAPALGYGPKALPSQFGPEGRTAFNPLENKQFTPVTPGMLPGTVSKAVTPVTPGITPGVVKKPRGV